MDPLLLLAATLGATVDVAPTTPDDGPAYVSSAQQCAAVAKDPAGVLVLGDSMTRKGAAQLEHTFFHQGRPVCIDGRNGRTTAQGVEVLRGYVARQQVPATVVVALGTNDVLGSPAAFRTRLTELVALLPREHRLLLVDTWYTGHDPAASAANRVIADVAASRGATVIGFHDWLRGREALLADHVHLTDQGSLERAWLIARAVGPRG